MFNWLENMRNKSSGTQRLWAFGISLFIVGIIFVIWLAVIFPNFLHNQDMVAKNNQVQQYVTPSQNIWGTIGSLWSGVTSQYNNLQQSMKSINLNNTVQYQATSSATTTPTSGSVGSGN
jgi:predicted PurR-regulated permease PerM